jgi:hypothetical protein
VLLLLFEDVEVDDLCLCSDKVKLGSEAIDIILIAVKKI